MACRAPHEIIRHVCYLLLPPPALSPFAYSISLPLAMLSTTRAPGRPQNYTHPKHTFPSGCDRGGHLPLPGDDKDVGMWPRLPLLLLLMIQYPLQNCQITRSPNVTRMWTLLLLLLLSMNDHRPNTYIAAHFDCRINSSIF